MMNLDMIEKNHEMRNVMKSKSVKQKINPILHYEVLFLVLALLYIAAPVRNSDDMWFITTFLTTFKGNLAEFLMFRYETWSTRLLLETYSLLLLYVPTLYRISMPLWLVFIAAGFIRLLVIKDIKTKWMICFSMLMLPVSFNNNAGFVCSTVNYVFTFACGLWAFLPVVESQRGVQIRKGKYVFSVVLMLLACNMEYYAPPLLLITMFFFIRSLKLKKGRLLAGLMLFTVIVSVIFAYAAPTNTALAYNVESKFFPEYASYGTMDKLRMALVATAGGLTSTSKWGDTFVVPMIVIGILFVLCTSLHFETGKKQGKVLSIIFVSPLALTLVTGVLARFLPEHTMWSQLFFHTEAGWKWDAMLPLCMTIVFLGTLLGILFQLDVRLGWMGVLAIINRMTMGVSSSVFSSGLRTFYPLFFVLCIAGACIAGKTRCCQKAVQSVFWSGVAIMYIINVCYMFL